MADEITEFSKILTTEEFDLIVAIGIGLGIIRRMNDFDIYWSNRVECDGTIEPLRYLSGNFTYCIEFADHSLSNDHIYNSVERTRELALGTRPERKDLLIICQHDEHAADLRGKINDNFPHDSSEQSDNPPVFVIRWLDVVRAHNKKKICNRCDRNGHLKMKDCIESYCDDCCRERCSSSGFRPCRNQKERWRLQDDLAHRSDYG